MKKKDITVIIKLQNGYVAYGTPTQETNATHICRVFDVAGSPASEVPEDLQADVQAIRHEYIRLKHTGCDFSACGQLAREKWLNNYLKTKFGI